MTSLPVLTPATLPLTTSVCVEEYCGITTDYQDSWEVYASSMSLQDFANDRIAFVEHYDDESDWRITDLQSGVVYSYRG